MKKDTQTNSEPLAIIETRVSDTRQEDGSHDLQEKDCRKLASDLGVDVHKVWRTTASGSVEDRDNFNEILEEIESLKGRVKYYICYSIERFTRSGPSTYEIMKKELQKRGVQMRDVEGIIQPEKNSMENLGFGEYEWASYSPSDTSELVEAGKSKANKRVMLTRMIGQEIINANEGYSVHPALYGFINVTESYYVNNKRKRRTTCRPDGERAKYYETLLQLRADGQKTDEEIVELVNKMGYLSKKRTRWSKGHKDKLGTIGGVPLTVKQLQIAVQRPGYAGVNCEKWTHGKAIRAQYPGLVSIETWNKANKGKLYIEELPGGTLKMHKNYTPEEKTKENPLYPYKDVIVCPICPKTEPKPFRGSASRGKSGQHYPAYHADHKINGIRHKRIGVSKYVFDKQVEDFINNLEFQPELFESFKLVMMDTFAQKQAKATEEAMSAGKRVTELQEKKQAATVAFITANTSGDEDLMQGIQAERTRLEQQLEIAKGYRDRLEVNQRDLEEFTWRVGWVMEHPQEFLLRAKNKPQRQAYFSLMFEELPTYQDVLDGTPKLSWVFRLDDSPLVSESDMVRRAGFEPA